MQVNSECFECVCVFVVQQSPDPTVFEVICQRKFKYKRQWLTPGICTSILREHTYKPTTMAIKRNDQKESNV